MRVPSYEGLAPGPKIAAAKGRRFRLDLVTSLLAWWPVDRSSQRLSGQYPLPESRSAAPRVWLKVWFGLFMLARLWPPRQMLHRIRGQQGARCVSIQERVSGFSSGEVSFGKHSLSERHQSLLPARLFVSLLSASCSTVRPDILGLVCKPPSRPPEKETSLFPSLLSLITMAVRYL